MTKAIKKEGVVENTQEQEKLELEVKQVSEEVMQVLQKVRESGNTYGLQPFINVTEFGVTPAVRLISKNDKKETTKE